MFIPFVENESSSRDICEFRFVISSSGSLFFFFYFFLFIEGANLSFQNYEIGLN